ncbi:acyl-CoA dehydrogenase family protein [Novosphingobium sp. BL-52-GroH]|uniref:acyl-CoA dehydrogenase family protein n=1 Tax=Novosphingobium sp. BL-52-GroH TaxID=3349877 RepID=UPI003850A1D7
MVGIPRTVLTEEHEMFRDQVRRFVETEIVPHHDEWERQGIVSRDVWRKAGEQGLLCPLIPMEYGGAGADFGFSAVIIEELARVNATAVGFTLHSDVMAPYILRYGKAELKANYLPRLASGELIGALALTEPGIGSDLKAVRATARRDGDHYVINGSKTFITNGQNSGLVIVAVKTDPEAGRKGISLIAVEDGTPGFKKGRNLEKIGLHGQDTAELFFDDVRVPVGNLLGEENKGFYYLLTELAQERLVVGIRAAASIEAMLERTIAYTRDRKAFEQSVFDFQNTRFKLADAKAQSVMLRAFVDTCLALHLKGELTPELAAMVKLKGAEVQGVVLDELLQLHGGYGYMSEYVIGRAWVDARVMRIYAGSSEIMREIIARTL